MIPKSPILRARIADAIRSIRGAQYMLQVHDRLQAEMDAEILRIQERKAALSRFHAEAPSVIERNQSVLARVERSVLAEVAMELRPRGISTREILTPEERKLRKAKRLIEQVRLASQQLSIPMADLLSALESDEEE